jgi:hypothetical protein
MSLRNDPKWVEKGFNSHTTIAQYLDGSTRRSKTWRYTNWNLWKWRYYYVRPKLEFDVVLPLSVESHKYRELAGG